MTNNTVRDIRIHAQRARIVLEGALTVHDSRKSCGQNWADRLSMNIVKELMGRADIRTTAEFYCTVCEDYETKTQWGIEAITIGAHGKSGSKMTPEPQSEAIRKVG